MNDKSVLMYSGGLDSFLMSRLLDFDVIIMADLGTADNKLEIQNLLSDRYLSSKVTIVKMPIADWVLPNHVLPHRNTILAIIGSQYGNHIYFGFVAGGGAKDTDSVFKAQTEAMLNYFALDTHKVAHPGYPYVVHMPYLMTTKTELLQEYLNAGHPVTDLTLSRSCYLGNVKECGLCGSCLSKYIAFLLNGVFETIPTTSIFETIPTSANLEAFLAKAVTSCLPAKELREIRRASILIHC